MALIPMLVGIVVALFLTLVTVYFLFIIVMSERRDHHRPVALQTLSNDADDEAVSPL